MSDNTSRHLGTDLGLLLLVVIWGVNFSVVKVVLREVDPLALNALRFPLAAVVMWLFVRRLSDSLRPLPGDVLRLVALGLLGNVAYQACFVYGLDATLAGNASLLLATVPVWVLILSAVRGHERPNTLVVLGVAGTLVGMVLVVLGAEGRLALDGATLRGDLLMVAAAVLWSVYTVGAHRLVRRYGSLRVTAWTLWIGTPFLVLMGVPDLLRMNPASVSPLAWGGVAYAGVLSIGIAYLLWYRGVQRLGSSRTAVYSNLVPVAAILTAWVWLGEVPSGLQVLGALVILGSLALARWGGSDLQPRAPSDASLPGTRNTGSPPGRSPSGP